MNVNESHLTSFASCQLHIPCVSESLLDVSNDPIAPTLF